MSTAALVLTILGIALFAVYEIKQMWIQGRYLYPFDISNYIDLLSLALNTVLTIDRFVEKFDR